MTTTTEQLEAVIERLPEQQAWFVKLRFGLDTTGGGKTRSLREIGKFMALSVEECDDLETEAIRAIAALVTGDETADEGEGDEEGETAFTECPVCGSGLEVRGTVDCYSEVEEIVDGSIVYAGSTAMGEAMEEECDEQGRVIVYCSSCDWKMAAEG